MGAGNPTISRETKTQVPAACQPQPWQAHIIKLIPQLQKPTRKISDTWIIDTGKRETRYQLVKGHQTIRRPHTLKGDKILPVGLSLNLSSNINSSPGFQSALQIFNLVDFTIILATSYHKSLHLFTQTLPLSLFPSLPVSLSPSPFSPSPPLRLCLSLSPSPSPSLTLTSWKEKQRTLYH